MTDDETIIEKVNSYWKTIKNQELINDGIIGQEKEQRLIPSRATKYAFREAIKLARADEREKIKGIIYDVSCDEDSRCFDDDSETYISLKALLKALEVE